MKLIVEDKELEETKGTEYKLPKDVRDYLYEFIVFFPNDEVPEVLFHSIDPQEAYRFADEKYHLTGKLPTVIRITDFKSNISRIFSLRS